ncbi:peptidoglycan DD-metalloendopeptidase family protein [Enterovibrio sp. ZSDZ35]|uniref:Peptidoglycan DD-metalloendopeptidase family protein n=1 Tax=Enterovibrio qingdaonensis TaxID=2899818 RepID=A0ABT5QPN3_9GAMM|nr:peptidoglycan DD-metalloendopeptidase family protein [Enterovibrio sp. ZSDZ35]MDD1782953.1 peptidoglycan DD-metalloendopeptidase family protein [Enterovibrio sp. ZSDZ35]
MKILFFLPVLVLLAACSVSSPAPVSSVSPDYSQVERGSYRGSYYEVQKGDTLYYIAYITDRDVKEIIAANKLTKPYTIFPGQKLNLWKEKYIPPSYGKKGSTPAVVVATAPVAVAAVPVVIAKPPVASTGSSAKTSKDNQKYASQKKPGSSTQAEKKVEPKKPKEYSQAVTKSKPSTDKPVNKPTTSNKAIVWQWPSGGRVVSGFSSSEMGNKGIDIAGKRGQSITASADGKVVYAGNALRGYGNLIIIKHNDDYLSAYAHNDRIFVSEKQSVKKGQKIASMGNSGTNTVRLHFEIRYKGKSVNPLRYLPKR